MVRLQRAPFEPKQMDTSVVNWDKLVVSMLGCAHTALRTNIYIYDAFV